MINMKATLGILFAATLFAGSAEAAFWYDDAMTTEVDCLIVQDKRFCEFGGSSLPDLVVTQATPNIALNPGITFKPVAGQNALYNTNWDSSIAYSVEQVDELDLIKDISQLFTFNTSGVGGIITITETVVDEYGVPFFPAVQSTIGYNSMGIGDPGDPPIIAATCPGDPDCFQQDNLDLPYPVSKVYVTKDIAMIPHLNESTGSYGYIGWSILTQRVSEVPEPGFYGMLGMGLAGLFLVITRRRKVQS